MPRAKNARHEDQREHKTAVDDHVLEAEDRALSLLLLLFKEFLQGLVELFVGAVQLVLDVLQILLDFVLELLGKFSDVFHDAFSELGLRHTFHLVLS